MKPYPIGSILVAPYTWYSKNIVVTKNTRLKVIDINEGKYLPLLTLETRSYHNEMIQFQTQEWYVFNLDTTVLFYNQLKDLK